MSIEIHIWTWLNILIDHPIRTFPWYTCFGHCQWADIRLLVIDRKWWWWCWWLYWRWRRCRWPLKYIWIWYEWLGIDHTCELLMLMMWTRKNRWSALDETIPFYCEAWQNKGNRKYLTIQSMCNLLNEWWWIRATQLTLINLIWNKRWFRGICCAHRIHFTMNILVYFLSSLLLINIVLSKILCFCFIFSHKVSEAKELKRARSNAQWLFFTL